MEYRVQDGSRTLTFEGELISESSSARDGAPRWTELALYKTASGKYIVTQIGRSVVLHDKNCPRIQSNGLKTFLTAHPDEDPDDWTLDECIPEEYDLGDIVVEETRRWTAVTESPAAAIECLYKTRDGARSLSWLANMLFEQAAMKDRGIADAFFTEERV